MLLSYCVLMLAIATVSDSQDCTDYGHECEDEKDCCGGCCMSGICRDIYRDCRKADDPCLERFCPPDQECYIFQPKDCGGCGPYPDCRNAPPALQETTAAPPRPTSISLKLIGNAPLITINLIMLLSKV